MTKQEIDKAWTSVLKTVKTLPKVSVPEKATETQQLVSLLNNKVETLSRISVILAADRLECNDAVRFEGLVMGGLNSYNINHELSQLKLIGDIRLMFCLENVVRTQLSAIRAFLSLSTVYFESVAPDHPYARIFVEEIYDEFMDWCSITENNSILL